MIQNNLRELGASDKFFYYTASHGATMDIQANYIFRDKINPDALKAAFEKALSLFPEFSYRPVIHDGKIFCEPNSNPVKFYDDNISFGTVDTNGYLFAIKLVNEKHALVSTYHGLSDWNGLSKFLNTAMYYYSGLTLSENEMTKAGIRTKAPEGWITSENLDPYNTYADENITPSYAPDMSYYPLPVKYFDPKEHYSRCYQINIKLADFLKTAKNLHTSFMPLMMSLMFKAVNNIYDIGTQNMLIALPADLRTVYNASTIVNFSDAVFTPITRKYLENTSHSELCANIRNIINAQRKPENYARNLFNKAQAVRDFERENIISISKKLTSQVPGGVTWGTTYLGIMDLPGELNNLFENIYVDGPFGVSYFMITTFKDEITIISTQRFDDGNLARSMNDELINMNFSARFTDRGHVRQNVLDPEKLQSR